MLVEVKDINQYICLNNAGPTQLNVKITEETLDVRSDKRRRNIARIAYAVQCHS